MIKTPAIVAKPHGVGPELDDEGMQLRGRHEGFDVVPARPAGPLGIAEDLAPASGQQALDRGGENVRHTQPKRSTSDDSKTAFRDPAAVRAPHPGQRATRRHIGK
jgi:hypothetical protein